MPVSDAELRTALSRALGRPVSRLERRPWPYASSAPMEELRVPGCPPLLLKELSARDRASRPAFLVDPRREIDAYTMIGARVGAPACHAAHRGAGADWLVLERVDGVPLWQAEGLEPWAAAARWAARLHASPPPARARLLRYDATFLRRWLRRALAMTPELEDLRAAAESAVQRLGAWPVSLVHGELYASNVLVQPGGAAPRVRVVDWETVGLGPGPLDLAALVAGDWPAADRDAIVAAYRAALPAAPGDFEATLDAARLVVALQWLGWSATWSPPAEHRHDWLGDARTLAARIAA